MYVMFHMFFGFSKIKPMRIIPVFAFFTDMIYDLWSMVYDRWFMTYDDGDDEIAGFSSKKAPQIFVGDVLDPKPNKS